MKKSGANARWNKLSPKQQQTLDEWLFVEKLNYAEILARARAELGFTGSESSLARYYARRRQERVMTELREAEKDVAEISGAKVDAEALQAASMKLLGQYLFRRVREAPEKVKEWAPLAALLAQNDRNEVRRAWLALAKEKFQFDAVEQALQALPELRELEEARKDPNLTRYEENARWNRARLAVFGFLNAVHPESAEEEAEMLAAMVPYRPPNPEEQIMLFVQVGLTFLKDIRHPLYILLFLFFARWGRVCVRYRMLRLGLFVGNAFVTASAATFQWSLRRGML